MTAAPEPAERRSLFGEILDWMLAPLLLLWPLSLALTWLVAQHVADLPYDRALGDTVNLLAKRLGAQPDPGAAGWAREAALWLHAGLHDSVSFQVTNARGELVGGDAALPIPGAGEAGATDELRFRTDRVHGENVRVAYRWVNGAVPGQWVLVQVAETLSRRSQLATEIVKAVVVPEFVMLPLAVLLVWLALARGLAPLNALQQRIRARASDDLSAIDEHQAPEEVAPLVRAINDLLARQHHALQTHQRFLADAAHQLKTPLAGLRTQVELAQRELQQRAEPGALADMLRQMGRATEGAAHLVNQLLSMARTDARQLLAQRQLIALDELAKEVMRDFVPRAIDKRIDLGFEGPSPAGPGARVSGHATLLRELIVNLVDNALHYTPPGGTVTLRVLGDPFGQVVVLQVEDSGPGIPVPERDLVFQPFYRLLGSGADGSGLGLAIVAEVARLHGSTVTLEDARPPGTPGPPGARFTLRLPVAP